jgi:organic radical activating enzyme
MCGGQGTQFDGELHNGATWRCDTLEVWMQAKMVAFEDSMDEECKQALRDGANLILTGGEPTMQEGKLKHYIQWVRNTFNPDCYVEVETNGTILPTQEFRDMVNQFNISPKLKNSGNELSATWKPKVIEAYNNHPNAVFKFVVSDHTDYAEIREYYLDLVDPKKVWLMPAGENQDLLSNTKEVVAEMAKKYHHKLTNRLHIEIWDKKTGV